MLKPAAIIFVSSSSSPASAASSRHSPLTECSLASSWSARPQLHPHRFGRGSVALCVLRCGRGTQVFPDLRRRLPTRRAGDSTTATNRSSGWWNTTGRYGLHVAIPPYALPGLHGQERCRDERGLILLLSLAVAQLFSEDIATTIPKSGTCGSTSLGAGRVVRAVFVDKLGATTLPHERELEPRPEPHATSSRSPRVRLGGTSSSAAFTIKGAPKSPTPRASTNTTTRWTITGFVLPGSPPKR